MYQIILGFRSLIYRRKQYFSLFLISLFGIGISLACVFISKGMINSLNEKAEIYYGGDFVVLSTDDDAHHIINPDKVASEVDSLLPEYAVVSERYDYDTDMSVSFYYEGNEVLQRVLKGVNFESEKQLFNKLNLISGNYDIPVDSNKVILSESIANKINVKTGDSFTMYIETIDDYINTVDLVVAGIFRDSSVFGLYTTYMDRVFLNKCLNREPDFVNRICVDFPDRTGLKWKSIQKIQGILEQHFDMFRLVDNKKDFYNEEDNVQGLEYAIIDLKANLNNINILKSAMTILIDLLITFLVIIIVAGISSTYKVIIMKRINEMGIYMAIGMKKSAIMVSLLFETLFLLLSGAAAGLIFSFILCKIASLIDFTFIPSFSIFLTRGCLIPSFSFVSVLIILAAVIVTTLLAVYFSIKKTVNIMPCNALAVTE